MPPERHAAARDLQRLHPSSLLFGVGLAAKRLLLPGLLALLAFGRKEPELWLILLFVPAVAGTVLHYWSYRYRFAEEELIIREGIITRNERHIPYARIQNIDLAQNPLHRRLGVAEVRLETAAGDKPEAIIRVLSLEAVREMRSRVFIGRPAAGPEVPTAGGPSVEPVHPPARVLLQLPSRDVLLAGLISNRGLVVVAAALGTAWQLDLFERWGLLLTPERLQRIPLFRAPGHPLGAAVLAIGALIVALALLRLLSMGLALLKLHGFLLSRRGEDLRAEYGLFTRISKTIPRHRIQTLSIRESPLHRWFGRAEVQVETAGGVDGQEASGADRIALAPLIPRARLPELLRDVLPELELEAVEWRPIAPRAQRRLFVRFLPLVLLLAAGAVAVLGGWGLLAAVPLLPLAYANARLQVKYTAYALTPGAVLHRSGWWVRRLSVARFSKIQVLELRASPFDRRHRMASLRVDTAGSGRIGQPFVLTFLEAGIAAGLLERLSREAGRTAFRW